jgi:hypothetical protein
MKRKLIDFEVFKKIKDESLSAAEAELTEAEDVLAKALNVDKISLHCFGESDVTYETPNHSFIHATYRINENSIILDNIEELVIDEQTAKREARGLLSKMVEDILNNNEQKAAESFESYISLPSTRRSLMEGKVDWLEKGKDEKKGGFGKKKKDKKGWGKKAWGKKRPEFKPEPRFQVKASKKMLKEWARLTENVNGYLDFQELGPVVSQSEVRADDKGNVTAVKIPTTHVRNEAKILNLTYKNMLDTELKVLRGKMKTVHEDAAFCHAMADLRRANSLSDNVKLEQVLEAIATKWPEVLYLTQTELASEISQALESVGESNYDDEMCIFFAEGILRTATNAFSERVNRIARLTGNELDKDNVYESFQNIVHKFYPTLDEQAALEMQVFVDLYNAMVEVHTLARNEGNEALCEETVEYLKGLHSILRQEAEPNLQLAAEAAGWLAALVEANVAGAEENWNVSNSTYLTKVGEHPRMAWCANQGDAIPSKYPGDWGGKLPVSDGKSYKNGMEEEMRNRAWGNWSSDETWPSLKNPYILKPFGDYKMKEKSAVDDGQSDWSRWQSNDTWPNLQNPNVKESPWRKGHYKMKSDNLVEDK